MMLTPPNAPPWLTATPVAHRGLHNDRVAIYENTLSAAKAAVQYDYSIECDVQETADGAVVVFHDDELDRLTSERGPVRTRTVAQLEKLRIGKSTDTIPTLERFLSIVDGKVPLIVEIKSRFDGDLLLAKKVCSIAARYSGPIALKSFDPEVVTAIRHHAPAIPRGIIAMSDYSDPEWNGLSAEKKSELANLLHFPKTAPDFLSWHVGALRNSAPFLSRLLGHRPVLTWTVRNETQRKEAARYADQIIFEGFIA